MKKAMIGGFRVGGETPRIVATLHKKTEIKLLASPALREAADIIELRADKLYGGKQGELETVLWEIRKNKFPVIFTAREDEGYEFSRGERYELFSRFIPLVDAVDIDISSKMLEKVLALLKKNGKTAIVSHHDFRKTPTYSQLVRTARRARDRGADIVKLAVLPLEPGDVASLMRSCAEFASSHPAVFIPMGELGKPMRIYAAFFGSCLAYGCISAPAAPGQIKAAELNLHLGLIYPDLHKKTTRPPSRKKGRG